MKKLFVILVCLTAMITASMSVKAQSVTVVLTPGWNWISCPTMDTLDFSDALESITPMVGDMIKSKWGHASYMGNGQWRGNISQFYPGYGYMYKSNRQAPIMVTFNAQQPAPQVIVTTTEPTDITTNSATCGGNVASSDGNYVFVILRGICWSTNPNPTFNDEYVEVGNGLGSFTASMTDLAIGTTYYVRAFAVTADGTFYGEEKTFITRDGIPSLTTTNVTNITGVSASCGGNIIDDGGLPITVRGVCWSTSQNPTIDDLHTADSSGIGNFISSITGLNLCVSYYVRAYAVTVAGVGYGEEKSFTTKDGIPTLTTEDITNITAISATCGGNIIDDGGLPITVRGVCWSTSPNPTIADSHSVDSCGMGNFSSSITELNLNTQYYVRAYAINDVYISYGEQLCFTTRDGIPTLTTADVTNIGEIGATSGGNIIDDGGLEIIARGVCWSVSQNPTIADTYSSDGNGMGSFISRIRDLNENTTYYVRAYAANNYFTVYGNEICFTTLDAPIGSIDGLFSVSESQKVYFSQGNLQYIGSASNPYWKFADHQWDYFGNNGQDSDDQNIDRDLFGWGTSGYNHGAVCYQPWNTSGNNSDYYAYGSSTYNLNDQTGQADWGYNSINNGGGQENQWRTLTRQEWQYVFSRRSTTSGIRFAKAIVNGVNGVIILPDNWIASTYALNNTNHSQGNGNYNDNIISAIDWTNIFETNGAVFLPAAGYRHVSSGEMVVTNVNSYGHYWSAMGNGNNCAYHLFFVYFNTNTSVSNFERHMGFSVRLVHDTE